MENQKTDSQEVVYRVRPSRLQGKVKVSGAKNSVLYLQTASLLTSERIVIDNYPAGLLDAQVHTEMLEFLGKKCTVDTDKLIVEESVPPPERLEWSGRSIRNTLLILGTQLVRNGAGAVPLPGGCKLGERKYDIHEMLLRKMGAEVWEEDEYLCASAPQGLTGADIHLPLRSTGATHNAILCGCLAKGVTRVWNPHVRPETIDLVRFLESMGASITIYGQEHIEIIGQEGLAGTRYRVLPDNMEAISWLVGAVVTQGDVEIENFPWSDLEVPLIHLRESGAKFYQGDNSLIVRGGRCYPIEISTGPYPGINSDMQPLFAVYGACANGQSRIVDLRFAGRYGYAEEFNRMGGDFRVEENILKINGGNKLTAAEVTALDLRAGIALVLAGLVADGESLVKDAWQIERGYNDFLCKMKSLNGRVEK